MSEIITKHRTQGSVLGPALFNCFMAGLPWIFESLGVKCHLFADDTQFVVTFEKGDEMSARSKVVEIFATGFHVRKLFEFECIENCIHTVFPQPMTYLYPFITYCLCKFKSDKLHIVLSWHSYNTAYISLCISLFFALRTLTNSSSSKAKFKSYLKCGKHAC